MLHSSFLLDCVAFSSYIYSMTVTQTVEIPANHRLTIDVPREVPAGPVILTFTPKTAPQNGKSSPEETAANKPKTVGSDGKFHFTKKEWNEMMKDKTLLSLTGILHTDMTLDEIRMARLAKHL
jgi:hypothetical protein